MIELKNVSKSYSTSKGEVEALTDVSLTIKRGEIFGVIGHSGAGKSTLIRCVNLLERPTKGAVLVGGADITALATAKLGRARRNIGMIFQGFNLLKTATVYQNIAIPLKLTGISRPEVEKRVEKYLTVVGLEHRQGFYPSQLSGGEKQRVAIARALSHQPEVLLCDEATSSLDPETTQSILELLLDINQKFGITILLITHEMNVIQQICHRLAVLEKGQVVEQGPVLEVFQNPKHPTTRTFLSSLFPTSTDINDRSTGPILTLSFAGSTASQPALAQVAKDYQVWPNILAGNIVKLKEGHFGRLTVKLQGSEEETRLAITALRARGVTVEEETP